MAFYPLIQVGNQQMDNVYKTLQGLLWKNINLKQIQLS